MFILFIEEFNSNMYTVSENCNDITWWFFVFSPQWLLRQSSSGFRWLVRHFKFYSVNISIEYKWNWSIFLFLRVAGCNTAICIVSSVVYFFPIYLQFFSYLYNGSFTLKVTALNSGVFFYLNGIEFRCIGFIVLYWNNSKFGIQFCCWGI